MSAGISKTWFERSPPSVVDSYSHLSLKERYMEKWKQLEHELLFESDDYTPQEKGELRADCCRLYSMAHK